MDRKIRRKLFYSLFAAFIVLGIIVVLYANGWRIDLENFKVEKVGGIYVRSFPSDARLFLNGKQQNKNPGLFDYGRFIGNLLPKNYELKLASEGYLDWIESVSVNPSLISEIKYAVLIPKNSISAASGTIDGFWIENDQLITRKGGTLFYGKGKLSGDTVLWQNNNDRTTVTKSSASKIYFINRLLNGASSPTSTSINAMLSKNGIAPSSVREITEDGGGTIFATTKRIFGLNLADGKIEELASSSDAVSNLAVSRSLAAWTTREQKTGNYALSLYSRSSRSVEKVSLDGEPIKLEFTSENRLGILQKNGGFYIINGKKEPRKTASDAKDFYFSPSGSKVAVLENGAVEIFSIDGSSNYWRFRLPDTENIKKLEWYADENNLFVIYPSEARFFNLDDREIRNFLLVTDGEQFQYDEKSNSFYFIKNKELRKIVFPR